jgi:hypothetical protein
LLFLDEPTAGFDPVAVRRIRRGILDARTAGSTIFLTTHDMVTGDELCDRVAFLVDGRIISRGRVRPRHGATPHMKELLATLYCDALVQARNGFYRASGFVVTVIGTLLLLLPAAAPSDPATWVPAILAVDLQITTFFAVVNVCAPLVAAWLFDRRLRRHG